MERTEIPEVYEGSVEQNQEQQDAIHHQVDRINQSDECVGSDQNHTGRFEVKKMRIPIAFNFNRMWTLFMVLVFLTFTFFIYWSVTFIDETNQNSEVQFSYTNNPMFSSQNTHYVVSCDGATSTTPNHQFTLSQNGTHTAQYTIYNGNTLVWDSGTQNFVLPYTGHHCSYLIVIDWNSKTNTIVKL